MQGLQPFEYNARVDPWVEDAILSLVWMVVNHVGIDDTFAIVVVVFVVDMYDDDNVDDNKADLGVIHCHPGL